MVECVSPVLGRCAPPASALRLALRLGRSEVQKALRLLLLLVSLQLTFGSILTGLAYLCLENLVEKRTKVLK